MDSVQGRIHEFRISGSKSIQFTNMYNIQYLLYHRESQIPGIYIQENFHIKSFELRLINESRTVSYQCYFQRFRYGISSSPNRWINFQCCCTYNIGTSNGSRFVFIVFGYNDIANQMQNVLQ